MNRMRLIPIIILNIILQSSVFAFIPIGGAVVNLSLGTTILTGLYGGPILASIAGGIIGLWEDIQFGQVLGLRALLYFVLGFISGLLANQFYRDSPRPAIIMAFLGTILFFGFYSLLSRLISTTNRFIQYLTGPLLIEAILNTLAIWGLFYLFRRILRVPGFYR